MHTELYRRPSARSPWSHQASTARLILLAGLEQMKMSNNQATVEHHALRIQVLQTGNLGSGLARCQNPGTAPALPPQNPLTILHDLHLRRHDGNSPPDLTKAAEKYCSYFQSKSRHSFFQGLLVPPTLPGGQLASKRLRQCTRDNSQRCQGCHNLRRWILRLWEEHLHR